MYDPDPARVQDSLQWTTAQPTSDLRALIAKEPDWFVVATPHDTAVGIVPELLATGAKVLMEKPMGRGLREAEALVGKSRPDQLWVGLNYRFFAGITALLADVASGAFGTPVAVNAVVGHGGAPGMERSWKLSPVHAGGGALIDPGIHLLDLALLIAGEPLRATGGTSWQGFWNTGIEEECHLLLTGNRLTVVSLEISIVRWRSTFRVEVHGDEGYGIVEGRGRSYGPQTYRRGKRWGWQGGASQAASEERVLETSGDDVFERELDSLLALTDDNWAAPSRAADALRGMRLLEDCRTLLGLPCP